MYYSHCYITHNYGEDTIIPCTDVITSITLGTAIGTIVLARVILKLEVYAKIQGQHSS